jgi:hypothetical protein
MIRKTNITLIASLFLLISCKNPNKDIEFEKEVLVEIIPSIVDSTCHDRRIFTSPPPMVGEFKETEDGHVIIDTSLATANQKIRYKIWLKKQDSIKADTSEIILAIDPKISYSEDSLKKEFANHFKGKNILNLTKYRDSSSYNINIHAIKLNKNFKFKNSKEFSNKLELWQKKYDFVFSGFFNVSRILFDESRKYGILSAGYTCGDRCGEGYIIYIKKIKDKWVIDKIEGTWIA